MEIIVTSSADDTVIGITKTCLDQNINNQIIALEGYTTTDVTETNRV